MHELSLAIDLVERAMEVAQRENAVRIKTIKVCVGDESGVDPHALAFAFSEASKGTYLENSELKIEFSLGRVFQFKSMEVLDV